MPCKTCGFGGAQPGIPCPKCGTVEQPPPTHQGGPQTIYVPQGPGVAPGPQKSRIVAGLLGIFFGGLGVHRFYLGYTGIGILMLLLQFVGWSTMCFFVGFFISIPVGIWGTIEGILILVGVMNKDAFGRPLI